MRKYYRQHFTVEFLHILTEFFYPSARVCSELLIKGQLISAVLKRFIAPLLVQLVLKFGTLTKEILPYHFEFVILERKHHLLILAWGHF